MEHLTKNKFIENCSLIRLYFWVETATIPLSSYKQYAVNMHTVITLAIHALTTNPKHMFQYIYILHSERP